MTAALQDLKDGDIFRWAYREPDTGVLAGYQYHCCSRIAIVSNGILRDTYWYGSSSSNRSFDLDDLQRLDITFLGNLADLENVGEWMADYYDEADIVNLNHANSSRNNFYIRNGAKRSAAKMLEAARHKMERAQSEEQSAARRVVEYREAIAKIEAGEIEGVHL